MNTNTDLLRQVEELTAREAIRDCIQRFCRALDRLDRELLASVFHADAQLDYGSIYRGGVEGFVEVAMQFQGAMRDTHHQVGNVLIEIHADEARAESYVHAHHVIAQSDGLMELTVGARYLDRFERRGGQWRIAFRTEVLDWGRMVPIGERWFEDNEQMSKGLRSREDLSYRFLES
ncbi:MAG: nuclear transport factor 2 family protein [Gammaproteobacteria bacterium]|nr:nuclear transport factor 2 family protein [Gammaproteobacteria bacterium]